MGCFIYALFPPIDLGKYRLGFETRRYDQSGIIAVRVFFFLEKKKKKKNFFWGFPKKNWGRASQICQAQAPHRYLVGSERVFALARALAKAPKAIVC